MNSAPDRDDSNGTPAPSMNLVAAHIALRRFQRQHPWGRPYYLRSDRTSSDPELSTSQHCLSLHEVATLLNCLAPVKLSSRTLQRHAQQGITHPAMSMVLSELGCQQPHWAVRYTKGKQVVYGIPKAWVKPHHLKFLNLLAMQQGKLPRSTLSERRLSFHTVERVWEYLRQSSEAVFNGYKGVSYRHLSKILKLDRKTVRRIVEYLAQCGFCRIRSTRWGLAVYVVVNQPLRACFTYLSKEVRYDDSTQSGVTVRCLPAPGADPGRSGD